MMTGEPKLNPEQEAEIERLLRRSERREKRERMNGREKFHPEWGSWATEAEEFSQ